MADSEPDTIWTTTSWSLVARAAAGGQKADAAWTSLVERYREPVIRAGRRILRGHPATNDIMREFVGYLFEHDLLPRADRERGLFRCYLQGVVRRFVLDALRRRDAGRATDLEQLELSAPSRPDVGDQDEAAWSEAVLGNATRRYSEKGTQDGELLLRYYGVPPFEQAERESLCSEFGISRNALNQALHRGRQELRKLVLEEVRETVGGPRELHQEMTMVVNRLVEARPGLFGPDEG